jgi:dienelactone hydrolase
MNVARGHFVSHGSFLAVPVFFFLAQALPGEDLDRSRPQRGVVQFTPAPDRNVPETYRLTRHRFVFELARKSELPISGVSVSELTFPSPVESPFAENNTVHAEFFRPPGAGPFPAVIVLEILMGGDELARIQANMLAQKGIAALFVRMAYYGPRSPKSERIRMLSTNIPRSMDAMRQTVLDCRRAAAWLESRPEIDGKKLGIMGTSLGSFLAALTAEMEPKLNKVALLFGGGGFVDAYYDHPRARSYVDFYEKLGGTRKLLKDVLAPIDPLTCANNLKAHDVLIVAAKRDDIVPPSMAKALWKASGEPKIVWFDCTHYGAALFVVPTMEQVLKHFMWK